MKKAFVKTSIFMLVLGLALTTIIFGCNMGMPRPIIANGGGTNVRLTMDNGIIKIEDGRLISCAKSVFGEVIVPEGVTAIGLHAFWGCTGLTSITIPNSVTFIGRYAFYGCENLTSVTFSDTNGWAVWEYNYDTKNFDKLTDLQPSDLQDSASVATVVKYNTYSKRWKKNAKPKRF